ncbi:Farnesyl pyrophosphate synthase [Paramicrosporidium saccamoebae]|uniref:Farnesyl pyrophosphate synthase n=1 Tax=Paramicrosporidium saccamoebae TaxID=1246581 RepID=A0A2H9TKL2_9FUNG|nr:Farnesyl pyrophosphate synthase [Paramicrosporidium saccamoebae]
MDSSLTRRGQECWYRTEQVGMVAINDCFVLHSMIFRTLRRFFGKNPAYVPLFELFIDTKMRTELGQLLDLLTAPVDGPRDLNRFSMDLYRRIVRFKTAYYSFYLPVIAALLVGGYFEEAVLPELESVLIDLGELFQIQDDYLDCFGDPKVIGKIGTDIVEGKCTWLIVTALKSKNLTAEMRASLAQHYGQKNIESEAVVRGIYNDLDLQSEFRLFEKSYQDALSLRIESVGNGNRKLGVVLQSFAKRIFGRQK